ncbi:MFS transporter [uncultured Methanobrevibacter sp.]|uniref:MFS transporter n=1 Tax=uncultured Methanobrevibacter sp. TaxID=253161 RepID=UPI0025F14DDF|nr:MFS transporter [uncultured Methanobrevibacter sp.]
MGKINISEKKLIVFVAAIAQLIQQLIANMTVVALPQILIDFNFSSETIMWVNLIYLCALVAVCLPFAKIISQYGVKRCIVVSVIGLLISVAISVLSINQFMLLFARLIQGFTSASLSISLYVMIAQGLPENEMGSALGIVGSAGYVGMLIAPSFMGLMLSVANWRFAFLILIPILMLILFLLSKIKTEWVSEKAPIDNIGSLLYVLVMALFTYGVTVLDEYGSIPIIISFILFLLFFRYEKKHPNPIYNLKLLRNVKYVIGNYAAMITYFTTTIAITALTFYLQYILDFEEYIIGLILIISPIIMIGISGLAGRLSNKIDPRIISGIAMSFICISMVMFFFIDFLPFNIILVACALQGIGNGLFSAPNNKYVLTLVDEKDLPDASSLLSTSKEFGKILSGGIYTLILSIYIGNQALGPEHLDHMLLISTNLMMFINAILAFSATFLLFYSKYKYDYDKTSAVANFLDSINPLNKRKKS